MKFWITVSTNGVSTRFFHKWNNFHLFWFRLGYAWLWLVEKFLQKWRWFSFFAVATRLSCKTMCTVTAKQHKCRFSILKRNLQNVAAGFALFTVVETSRCFVWNMNTLFISACWKIHISNSLVNFVVDTQFFLSIFGWFKWDINVTIDCLVPSSSFFSEGRTIFVCFCRLYVLL